MNKLHTSLSGLFLFALTAPVHAASVQAEPLPEVAHHSVWDVVLVVAAVLGVLGFVGLLVATAQKVDLHYGMGDVYLSVPLGLACWTSLVGFGYMAWRGDDLLPYLQAPIIIAGVLFILSLVLSFILVKRCNPQAGIFGLIFAAFGRLFVDILSQLCSILVVLSGIWVIFGGRKQNGEKVSFLGRLGCAFAFAWMFKLVWGSIRTTTREEVSSTNGYLLAVLNMVCIAGAVYGGYAYAHRMPAAQPAELVQAVMRNQQEVALKIIAENPMMDRTPGIHSAIKYTNGPMLNILIRSKSELAETIEYAQGQGLANVLAFLQAKQRLSWPDESSELSPSEVAADAAEDVVRRFVQ